MLKNIDGIRMGGSATPYVAAAEGALRAAEMWDGETWMLLGLTGLGFHLVVDPGTCPSSPTSYDWTYVHTEAMRRIGVSTRCVRCLGDADGYEASRKEAVELAKQSLDRGVPAVFRTFDYAEFGILTGYDEDDGVFFVSDHTGNADPVLFANLGRPHGHPFLFVQAFEDREPIDLERAATDSLRYGVACWHGEAWPREASQGYEIGVEGYRALVAALNRPDADPLGLRYILRILADARAGVATYVRHLNETGVVAGIGPAVELYEQGAERLGRVAKLLPAEPPYERALEADAIPEASQLLDEAAEFERQAIDHIAVIVL